MKGGRSRGAPRHRWVDNYPEGWAIAALEEICSVKRGASPRPAGDPRYFGGAFPWFKISDASAEPGRWLTTTEETVNEAGKARSVFLRAGALILSNSGTTGRPRFIGVDGCIHDGWPAFDNFKGVDPLYLFYVLSWHTDYLTHLADGSVQKNLNTSLLKGLEIGLPPIETQRRIAHILGTLDDKIELNRRMNQTLEAIARVIFKSWFIDFDPVYAKAEGREPVGMDPETAALFPDSFQDSPLGTIPKGWEVGTVDQAFSITMGQSPPGSTYNEDGQGLPFYQGRADFGFRFPARRVYCTAPTRFAEPGDTLITVRAPVGSTNMAIERCCVGRGVSAARHSTSSRSYTYYFMQSLRDVFDRFEAEGTVFGSISKKDFHAIRCVLPPRRVVECFESLCFPFDDRIEGSERQIRTLAALRDTLLPKLISGDLWVKDAKRSSGRLA